MNEYNYQNEHMGTTVSLAFVCESKSLADKVASETFSIIHDYELKFSRFNPESELSRLNHLGSLKVSPELLTVLDLSLDLTNKTQGGFNPLIQVAHLGYRQTFKTIKEAGSSVIDTKYNTDPKLIQINHSNNQVTLGSNQQLDFGGILKGYLADLLSSNIIKDYSDISGCIINIGGDLSARGFDTLHEPFIFFLYNPITGKETPVTITNQSLATSGTYNRRWQTSEGTRHHIVDADSQQNPQTDLVSISLIADNGALAEALCKLFLTRGAKAALKTMPPSTNNYSYFATNANGDTETNIIWKPTLVL